MAVKFTFSAASQRLVDDFKAACRARGRKYSWVLSGAMRYYVAHPQANGWGTVEREVIPATKLFDLGGKPVKPLAELSKPKRKKKS